MRWRGNRKSNNVKDRRNATASRFSGPLGGGGLLRLLPLAVKFLGLKGATILALGVGAYGLYSGNLADLFDQQNPPESTASALRIPATPTPAPPLSKNTATHSNDILIAFNNQQSDVQVTGSGVVSRLLRDDNEGSRHQKFILEIGGGTTVLVAHNIDLAPRIGALAVGDRIEYHGEYEWNKLGGVLHWTHHDPAGRHPDGWLKRRGVIYK